MPPDGPDPEGDWTREVARRWADAINARNLPTLLELAHPEIECLPLQIGVRGAFQGRDGVRRWMEEMAADDLGHHVHIERVRSIGPGRALLLGTVFLHGEEVAPYALMVQLRDGLVARMRSYLADEPTLDKLGLLR